MPFPPWTPACPMARWCYRMLYETPLWLSHHWVWSFQGYWWYRNMIDWLINWLIDWLDPEWWNIYYVRPTNTMLWVEGSSKPAESRRTGVLGNSLFYHKIQNSANILNFKILQRAEQLTMPLLFKQNHRNQNPRTEEVLWILGECSFHHKEDYYILQKIQISKFSEKQPCLNQLNKTMGLKILEELNKKSLEQILHRRIMESPSKHKLITMLVHMN